MEAKPVSPSAQSAASLIVAPSEQRGVAEEKAYIRVVRPRFKIAPIEVDGLAVALGLAVERGEREEWLGEGGVASHGAAVVAGGVGRHVPFLVGVAEIVVLVGIAF